MNTILDRIAKSHSYFRPKSSRDLLALRLAEKLGEPNVAHHYSKICEQYSENQVLAAYRRATKLALPVRELARRFHKELESSRSHASNGHQAVRLAAFKIERRSIAVAVCHSDRLDHLQTRQLSSIREKAEKSAMGFVRWLIAHLDIESAAIECMPASSQIQRAVLTRAVVDTLRENGVSVWEVSKRNLLAGYSYPPIRARRDMRLILASIWPAIEGGDGVLDAAALGLYVQTERLFLF